MIACRDSDSGLKPSETDFTDLLTNQVDQIVIPTASEYLTAIRSLRWAAAALSNGIEPKDIDTLRSAFKTAYIAYQAAAIHNYYATLNQALVVNSNLFPLDLELLAHLIETESYDFNTKVQERANGFPALDYMLFGVDDLVDYLSADSKRVRFIQELTTDMMRRAERIHSIWTGELRENFIQNGGTGLGSSISVQLNEIIIYLEDHIRENKVGIPIGRVGPNDSPVEPDETKRESYYQSLFDGNEDFVFDLLEASIREFEDIFLGESHTEGMGMGYDDLLNIRGQEAVTRDINSQFNEIYSVIADRQSISGDDELYQSIQELVTLFKTDVFSILNVQDADGANDGD